MIISVATNECPPVVGSRGTETATTLSGATGMRVSPSLSHVQEPVVMEVGLGANRSNYY